MYPLDKVLLTIAIMALVTYLCRMLPMVIFRKKITNVYVRSFLIYLPYGVLAAMVFPAVFFSTTSIVSSMLGTLVAIILAYHKKGLVLVAVSSTVTVLIVELLIGIIA